MKLRVSAQMTQIKRAFYHVTVTALQVWFDGSEYVDWYSYSESLSVVLLVVTCFVEKLCVSGLGIHKRVSYKILNLNWLSLAITDTPERNVYFQFVSVKGKWTEKGYLDGWFGSFRYQCFQWIFE